MRCFICYKVIECVLFDGFGDKRNPTFVKKLFIDHNITSIQDYFDKKTLKKYDAVDINVYQANIFHTKLLIKDIDLQNYLFKADVYELSPKTRLNITNSLRREMIEIFSGTNIY